MQATRSNAPRSGRKSVDQELLGRVGIGQP
jgi:hypothetical protein